MNAVETTCPFCNAVVAIPAMTAPGQMLTCSRCDERFKLLGSAEAPTSSPGPASLPGLAKITAPRRQLTNGHLALIILGVMAVMAAAGTVLALMTQKYRRENDTGLKQSRSGKRPRQLDP